MYSEVPSSSAAEYQALELEWALPSVNESSSESKSFRERLRDILEHPESSFAAKCFHYTIFTLIIGATATVVIQTVPTLRENPIFAWLEGVTTLLFTVEFALRFVACESVEAFVTNGFNLADLLAIFPGYLELARLRWSQELSLDAVPASPMLTLRIIRLMRILRLVKVVRHSKLLTICVKVLTKCWDSGVAVVVALLLFLVVVSASLLYLVESDHCEELGVSCSGFDSIPAACWFSIMTLTKVGYGDQIPRTTGGKIIAGVMAVVAVICLSLAVGLLADSFAERFREERTRRLLIGSERLGSPNEQRTQEFREMEETSDALVSRLVVSASVRNLHEPDSTPVCMMAMLRSIQERSSMLNFELKSFVHTSLGAKISIDTNDMTTALS